MVINAGVIKLWTCMYAGENSAGAHHWNLFSFWRSSILLITHKHNDCTNQGMHPFVCPRTGGLSIVDDYRQLLFQSVEYNSMLRSTYQSHEFIELSSNSR